MDMQEKQRKLDHDKVENLTDKPLSEFEPGVDTIYVQRNPGGRDGYMFELFGTFEGMDRGLVYVHVQTCNPVWGESDYIGKVVKVKKTSCYLYGRAEGDTFPYAHVHWFGKDGRLK